MGLIWTSNDSEFMPRRSGYAPDWETLSATLGRALGSDYEHFLAEPVSRRNEGKTDWYTHSPIQPVPASELDGASRAALFERLEDMRRDIRALADRIESPERRGANKGLAKDLRAAIRVPDENLHVWSLGGEPLLVAWGRLLYGAVEDEEPGSLVLEGQAPSRAVPGRLAVSEASTAGSHVPQSLKLRRRFPWAMLLWLVFAGLMGLSYFLLLRACGIVVALEDSVFARFLPHSCHAGARTDPLALGLQRQAELLDRIRQAELDVARIQGNCATPVQLPRPVQPKPECQPRRTEREEQFNALKGKLEVALEWDGFEDLDLHVGCPGGEVFFNTTASSRICSGGYLDVDVNARGAPVADALEHAVWESNPPQGAYNVYVILFNRKSQAPRTVPFKVYVTRGGRRDGPFSGTVSEVKERVDVTSFTIDATPPPPPPVESPECANQ